MIFLLYQFMILRFLSLSYRRNDCSVLWRPLVLVGVVVLSGVLVYWGEVRLGLLGLPTVVVEVQCLVAPPALCVSVLIVGSVRWHVDCWKRNDYAFCEEKGLLQQLALYRIPSQVPTNILPVQPSLSLLPKTFNDWKVLSMFFITSLVLHVLLVGSVGLGSLRMSCPGWVSCTLFLWFFTVWCGAIGALTYFNRLYQANLLASFSIAIGIVLPVLWALVMVLNPSYTPTPFAKFLVVTVAALYLGIYFFLIALYMIFDMFDALKGEILVYFYP